MPASFFLQSPAEGRKGGALATRQRIIYASLAYASLRMENLYERVGRWTEQETARVWQEWLWESDCNAPPSELCCDMNRMHGLGVLCCVNLSKLPTEPKGLPELLPLLPAIHLHGSKPICEFSLRELMDQLECMQLHWGQIVGDIAPLHAIMARLGSIVSHAFATTKPEDGYENVVLDDPQHTTVMPQQQMSIISRKSLRQMICVLLGLARVQDIVQRSVVIPPQCVQSVVKAFKQHHIEASMDFFNGLQQMMRLAPGMRLVYRTNFAGMYNDVSQVIYFHFPKFARQPQRPLADVPKHSLNLLPLIRELLPDVPVSYDDDSTRPKGYSWLISCGAVFLAQDDTIFRADTLLELVCFFLQRTGRTLTVEEGRKRRAEEACFTEHGHVLLV